MFLPSIYGHSCTPVCYLRVHAGVYILIHKDTGTITHSYTRSHICTAIRVLSYIDEANQVKQGAQEADLQSLPTCTYYHGLLDESRRQSGVAGQANSNNKHSGVGNDHESSGDRANAHASADRGEHIIDMSNSASSHNNNAHDVSSIHHNHYSAVADSSIDINDDDGDDDDSMPSCLICTCEYEEGEEIRILPCHPTHHFHKDCVDNCKYILCTVYDLQSCSHTLIEGFLN